jgi:hypothetical protein
MNKHTKEPWTLTHVRGNNFAVQEFDIRGMFGDAPNVYPIFNKNTSAIDDATVFCSPENAARIVACVNAMEGLTNEQVAALRASRDELLAALKDVLVMWKSPQPTKLDEALSWRQNDINAEAAARAAISRAAATGQPEQPK